MGFDVMFVTFTWKWRFMTYAQTSLLPLLSWSVLEVVLQHPPSLASVHDLRY
jgi:hypothetical protein